MLNVNKNTLFFSKLKKNAKIPNKKLENAGYDLYACFDEDFIEILPHQTKMIPTGICSAFDENYVFVLKERGSTGTKGIAQRSGIVDSGYRDEIFVPLTNTNNKSLLIIKNDSLYKIKKKLEDENYTILQNTKTIIEDHYIFYPYEKAITQGLLLPVPKIDVVEITAEELQSIPSERGLGKLGSSGK